MALLGGYSLHTDLLLQPGGGGDGLVPVLVLQVALVSPNILSVLSPTLVKGKGFLADLVRNLELLELLLGNVLRTATGAELKIGGAKLSEQRQLEPQHVVLA